MGSSFKKQTGRRRAAAEPASSRQKTQEYDSGDAPETPSTDDYRNRLQRTLIKTVLALPLLEQIKAEREADVARQDGAREYDVIIDPHLDFPAGRKAAREWILATLAALLQVDVSDRRLKPTKNEDQPQYVFARLRADTMLALIGLDGLSGDALHKEAARLGLAAGTAAGPGPAGAPSPARRKAARSKTWGLPLKLLPNSWPATSGAPRAIYQIWQDFEVMPLISASISTVKADAAHAAFKAAGKGIVWAVIDSGVDRDHAHFQVHKNLEGTVEGWHRDFTGESPGKDAMAALTDPYGHGTHVAGIIAGEIPALLNGGPKPPRICAYTRIVESDPLQAGGEVHVRPLSVDSISGMAPRAGIVSLRVLDERGRGHVSNIISALNWIQEINGYGRRIRIHGVNLSVGYPFDAEWFACGQSQLCVEVDRLVRSGVVVVVAAGNTGYGTVATDALGARKGGLALSINDPGNAELAITVGSTHREMPHIYGVSYFSGKGPTGDGRLKPDLLAPGEKVISCAAGRLRKEVLVKLPHGSAEPNYIEYTGTSMAAPHVSGCVAAFLSVKREFVGRPERVKEVFLKTATDLGRERTFQGAGLVDLMRAIQHV